jgi:tetratricopeptide (TPR) repeat protein
LEIPQGVREVIARRLTHLSQQCNRVLVLAAVLGREFDHDVLAQMSGGSADQLLDALDEAVAARVVSDVPGAPGRLRFDHVLIRDTLYDGLMSARRVHLHGLAVSAIEQLHGEGSGPQVAELARHSIAAGNQEKGVRYARQAAGEALEQLAYEEAARLYRLALEALELTRPVDPVARAELLLAVGDALTLAGSTADATQTFLSAAELARTAGVPELFARAALGYGGRSAWQRAGDDSRLIPLLEDALEALGDEAPPLRARLLARLAGALRDDPSLEPRVSHSREAVEIARRAGDDETLAYTLVGLFMATWGPEIEELVAITDEVSRLVESAGLAERALDVLTLQGLVAWLTLAEADAAALDDRYGALAQQLKQPVQQWQGDLVDTFWALFRGEFAAAEQLVEEALRSAEGLRSDADCSYRLTMFALRREQGRLSEVEDLIRGAVHEYPGYRSFRCFIPVLEWELGREEEARGAFDELAADDFGGLPRDSEWLFCLSLLAEVAEQLHDGDRAAALYRQLAPYGRINAMASGEVALGPVARYLGILASTTSRWDEAAAHFEDAIAMNDRIGARPLLAHTQHDYARMLLKRDQPGDRERARELAVEGVATYCDLGMDSWARAAAELV